MLIYCLFFYNFIDLFNTISGESRSDHFWIGLYLPSDESECSCPNNCQACRNKFVWIDGTPNVLDYWGYDQDPAEGERCVRLRHRYIGRRAWAATACNDQLKYICKAGE